MKDKVPFIILIALTIFLTSLVSFGKADSLQQRLSDSLLRFHVIANSDSKLDQSVKLKVRDAILKEAGKDFRNCTTRTEALAAIEKDRKKIESISNRILELNGMKYKAKAILSVFAFPIKNYGSITLPPGNYMALRVVLGSGSGKNWWCVMFPPLCFIDSTRGVAYDKDDKELKKVLNESDISSITAFNQIDINKTGTNKTIIFRNVELHGHSGAKIELRSKLLDTIKQLISKKQL